MELVVHKDSVSRLMALGYFMQENIIKIESWLIIDNSDNVSVAVDKFNDHVAELTHVRINSINYLPENRWKFSYSYERIIPSIIVDAICLKSFLYDTNMIMFYDVNYDAIVVAGDDYFKDD